MESCRWDERYFFSSGRGTWNIAVLPLEILPLEFPAKKKTVE
jgi:hypothetical protein